MPSGKQGSIRLAALGLALSLLAGLTACRQKLGDLIPRDPPPSTTKSGYAPIGTMESMDLVTENDRYALLYDPSLSVVGVYDKTAAWLWRSGATGEQLAGVASEDTQSEMLSQFAFSYVGADGRKKDIQSYGDSVKKDQVTPYSIEGGLRLEYIVGEAQSVNLFPEALSAAYVEKEYLPKLREAGKSDEEELFLQYFLKYAYGENESLDGDLLQKYKNYQTVPMYVAQQAPQKFQKRLTASLTDSGLTLDVLKAEYQTLGCGTAPAIMPSFRIPLEYTLTDRGLSVRAVTSELEYEQDAFKLTDFSLLPFFGATERRSDGYMLVPDGCGILVGLDNAYKDTLPLRIYRDDVNTDVLSRAPAIEQPAALPVYGMTYGGRGFLAVIEEGDSLAILQTSGAGHYTDLNHLYPSFNLWPSDSYQLDSIKSGVFVRYGKSPYAGDLSVSFHFLQSDNADYSGMAGVYRDLLFAGQDRNDAPVRGLIETMGVLNCRDTVLGFSTQGDRAFTTAEQVKNMLASLKNAGAGRVDVRYKNWHSDPLAGPLYTGSELSSKIGGSQGLSSLLSAAKSGGGTVYLDYQPLYLSKDRWFDGFSPSKQQAVSLSNSPATHWYDVFNPMDVMCLLNPQAVSANLETLGGGPVSALSLSSIGSDLYADYNKERYALREDTKTILADALKKLADKKDLLVSGSNAYLLTAIKTAADLPMSGSNYRIASQEVPFLQMVLHGYVDGVSPPVNQNDDSRKAFLKAVEYGALPCFSLYGGGTQMLSDSKYTSLRYTGMDNLNTVAAYIKEYTERLADTAGRVITDHSRLTDNVYATRYEGGLLVVTNYGDTAYTADGLNVPARDFAVIKGGDAA